MVARGFFCKFYYFRKLKMVSNNPQKENKDPRVLLNELQQLALQKSIIKPQNPFFSKETSDTNNNSDTPYHFDDPLGKLFHFFHKKILDFEKLITEKEFRKNDEGKRRETKGYLANLNKDHNPLLTDKNNLLEQQKKKTFKEKIKDFFTTMIMIFVRPFFQEQLRINSEIVRFGNSILEVFENNLYHQQVYNDQILTLNASFLELISVMQETRDRIKKQDEIQYDSLIKKNNAAFNNIFFKLDRMKLELLKTQETWEKRNSERAAVLHNSIIAHKQAIDDFVKTFSEKEDNISISHKEKQAIVQINAEEEAFFEDEFRGSSFDIKNRQEIYLPYFRNSENILDFGSGRGEFLELLRENNLEGIGVEINPVLVRICHEKNLNVKLTDGETFLKEKQKEYFDGIFCSQVIEHIPPANRLEIIKLMMSGMKKNSYCIIETVNPLSLYALSQTYFLDSSHLLPMHPETLRFMAKIAGFQTIEIKFLHPVPEKMQLSAKIENASVSVKDDKNDYLKNISQLNEFLYGYQDFALIAKK